MPDTYEVGAKAARYLLSRGHRHLGFFNLDRSYWPFRAACQSYANTAADAGATSIALESDCDDQSYRPHFAADAADGLVRQYLKLKKQPTALFIADDVQTAIVQPALQRAGVEIGPGKVEIISCNNERPYLTGLAPMPAEIDLCAEAIGHCGVEQLLWRINNQTMPKRVVTAVEPVVLDHDGKPFDGLKSAAASAA